MQEHPTQVSNLVLLAELIGEEPARRLYQDKLRPLFCAEPGTRYGDVATERAFAKLAVARELIRRWIGEELALGELLNNPQRVRDYLRVHFGDLEHECFVALFVDVRNRLIATDELSRGTLAHASVYPREVVKRGLRLNAAAVVFAHNHPSGGCEPSLADETLTQALKRALALVDIQVLDHFIVAGNVVISFADHGLL